MVLQPVGILFTDICYLGVLLSFSKDKEGQPSFEIINVFNELYLLFAS